VEYAGFSWTAGARKHRVSRRQVRHLVERAGLVFVREPSRPERPDEALRGIHAMAMRPGYGDLYEEAKTWLR
jgi:hypothetical protein